MNNHFGCGNEAGNLIRILLPAKVAFVLFTVRCHTPVFLHSFAIDIIQL